jgi:hypothetical protein
MVAELHQDLATSAGSTDGLASADATNTVPMPAMLAAMVIPNLVGAFACFIAPLYAIYRKYQSTLYEKSRKCLPE